MVAWQLPVRVNLTMCEGEKVIMLKYVNFLPTLKTKAFEKDTLLNNSVLTKAFEKDTVV